MSGEIKRTVMQLLLKGGCNYGRAPDIERMIRKQIGRELLDVRNVEVNFDGDDTVKADIIREVCKMGES